MSSAAKTCTACGATKGLSEYAKDKRSRDGHDARCKACCNVRVQAYREVNRETAREYAREYRAANVEAVQEHNRAYYKAHPEIWWANTYRRRAKAYGFNPIIEDFTLADLLARYGGACIHCGGPFEHLDHYPISVVKGGPHTLDNVAPSCASCNIARGNEERREPGADVEALPGL